MAKAIQAVEEQFGRPRNEAKSTCDLMAGGKLKAISVATSAIRERDKLNIQVTKTKNYKNLMMKFFFQHQKNFSGAQKALGEKVNNMVAA